MFVAIVLSVLIGVSLGLLGGGGSILTVPILVYAVGLSPKSAIATSLLVVGITSAVAALTRARMGQVDWRTGLLFGAAGMVGAFVGGQIARFVPGGLLLLGFAGMMLATSVAMIRGRRGSSEAASRRNGLPVARIVSQGVGVGGVAGLVGAGGGFLVVPALVLLGGLPMNIAIGTSLLVIAMQSFAGLVGHLTHVRIDWVLGGLVSLAAVAGSLVGTRLGNRLPQQTLRKGFGWFVLAMGFFVVGKQWPTSVRMVSEHWGVFAVAMAVAVTSGLGYWLVRRRMVTARRA